MLTQILFVMPSKAKHLSLTRFRDPLTLAPTGVDLRFTFVIRYAHREHLLMFSLRYGQDDKFAKKTSCGSTAILFPKLKQIKTIPHAFCY